MAGLDGVDQPRAGACVPEVREGLLTTSTEPGTAERGAGGGDLSARSHGEPSGSRSRSADPAFPGPTRHEDGRHPFGFPAPAPAPGAEREAGAAYSEGAGREAVPPVPPAPAGGGERGSARRGAAENLARPPRILARLGDPTLEEVCLPSRPESAALARRLARAVLRRQWLLASEQVDNGVLLVSELVGNAVRHTGARAFGLRMLRRRGWTRIEVRDPSRGLPCLLPVQDTDVSGRGLTLVDKLSDRWGVDLRDQGKTTWFEMRVVDR